MIAITGAAGFIGSNFAHRLVGLDHQLLLVGRRVEVIAHDAPMHKYAIQVTVAGVRDGALFGGTLKKASSWARSRRPSSTCP